MKPDITRRNLFLIALVFLLLFSVPSGIQPAAAAALAGPSDPADVGPFLDGAFAAQMKADRVSGAVVAVVKDGQVLYQHGYGYADLEKHTPVDPQKTLFRPGSVSKLFTWTAVMQLVEQGKISLDADVNTYLDFKIPATYPQPITMRHLLTHTPGFEDSSLGLFSLDADKVPSLGALLKTHIPARVYAPGTVSAYSNYGAALAGYIVERISGMPFRAYVDQNIFQPLGMTHSTFQQPLPVNLAPDMAEGYNFVNGAYLPGSFEFISEYPAGGLSATASDLSRFMIAHLQNGQFENTRILSEATAKQMHNPLFAADPALHGMAYGFFEDEVNGQKVISHGGDTILFHSGLYLLPEQNAGIFISTNAVGGAKTPEAIFKAFMDRYYPVTAKAAAPVPADFAARLGKYAGAYYLSRGNFTSIEKLFRLFSPLALTPDGKDGLLLGGFGGPSIRYTEAAPGRLVAEEGPMPVLMLQEDPSGQISLLTSMPWKMIKTPWYASPMLQLLIFIGGLLLFVGTLIGWLSAWLKQVFARRSHRAAGMGPTQALPQPFGARLAKLAAVLFMLTFIIFILGLGAVLLNINPVFGVPIVIFEGSPVLTFLLSLTPVLALLAALALVFAILAWVKRYWTARGRLFYTLLTVWFAAGVGSMIYWNLLF